MKKNSKCDKIQKKIKSLTETRKKAKAKKEKMKKLITAEFDKLEEQLYREFDAYDTAWLKSKKAKKEIKKLKIKLEECESKKKSNKLSKAKKSKTKKKKTEKLQVNSKPIIKVSKAIPVVKAVEPAPATAKRTTAKSPKTSSTRKRPDNLKRIEGIGPKIESLLRADGIKTFKQLSEGTR